MASVHSVNTVGSTKQPEARSPRVIRLPRFAGLRSSTPFGYSPGPFQVGFVNQGPHVGAFIQRVAHNHGCGSRTDPFHKRIVNGIVDKDPGRVGTPRPGCRNSPTGPRRPRSPVPHPGTQSGRLAHEFHGDVFEGTRRGHHPFPVGNEPVRETLATSGCSTRA